jgi:Fe2+ transport system protein FeoA
MKTACRSVVHLCPGENAVIARVHAAGRSGQRLLAMGLKRGCPLRFLRSAPLGDPLLIEIPGCVLCLRAGEARLVELEAVR